MKRNNLHVGLMAFAMLLVGASCSDDDNTLSYSTGAVQNTELKTILVQRGYTFNEDGNLLLDDLANNTTTLDLSGTQISTDALAPAAGRKQRRHGRLIKPDGPQDSPLHDGSSRSRFNCLRRRR